MNLASTVTCLFSQSVQGQNPHDQTSEVVIKKYLLQPVHLSCTLLWQPSSTPDHVEPQDSQVMKVYSIDSNYLVLGSITMAYESKSQAVIKLIQFLQPDHVAEVEQQDSQVMKVYSIDSYYVLV